MSELAFYSGSRFAEHFSRRSGPSLRWTYGDDISATVAYRFNTYGFRSDDFNPDAACKVYVCGASDTFGTGIDYAATWPAVVAGFIAAAKTVARDDVCLLNFSEGGCSNRYISRTLVQQCEMYRPDLVIAHFTYLTRSETLLSEEVRECLFSDDNGAELASFVSWGKWNDLNFVQREMEVRKQRPKNRRWFRRFLRGVHGFYKHYDPLAAVYDTLQQILLLQFYLKTRGIPFVFCVRNFSHLMGIMAQRNAALNSLIAALDRTYLLDLDIGSQEFWQDLAADGKHQGPVSHRAFADQLWKEMQIRMEI